MAGRMAQEIPYRQDLFTKLPGPYTRFANSMQEPPTGEPYAGEPPVRFGGRGARECFPTPICLGATFQFATAGNWLPRSQGMGPGVRRDDEYKTRSRSERNERKLRFHSKREVSHSLFHRDDGL